MKFYTVKNNSFEFKTKTSNTITIFGLCENFFSNESFRFYLDFDEHLAAEEEFRTVDEWLKANFKTGSYVRYFSEDGDANWGVTLTFFSQDVFERMNRVANVGVVYEFQNMSDAALFKLRFC